MRTHVLFSIAVAVGCTGGGDDDLAPDGGAVSAACMEATQHSDLAWIQTNVFNRSCTFMACHQEPAATAGDLNLLAGMARDELVNTPSREVPSIMRVVPGDPDASYLLVALGHVPGPPPSMGMMPLNSPRLCVEKRDAIERWIAAGALP